MDRPRRDEQAVLEAEPVDELRGRGLGWGPGERLALLGGHGRGDDRRGDVHARVDLPIAIARPLTRRDVEGDGGRDGLAWSAYAERELALARGRERHRLVASELHSLRPDARQARLA